MSFTSQEQLPAHEHRRGVDFVAEPIGRQDFQLVRFLEHQSRSRAINQVDAACGGDRRCIETFLVREALAVKDYLAGFAIEYRQESAVRLRENEAIVHEQRRWDIRRSFAVTPYECVSVGNIADAL